VQNELDSEKAWIHACGLKGSLSPQCKQLFDADGMYLTTDFDSKQYPDGFVTAAIYLENAGLCNCQLPNDIADRLNQRINEGYRQCGGDDSQIHMSPFKK
jgi:hypothetical protein